MPALWLFVAVGRRRVRALVVVAVLIGLAGSVVLAAVAGARRSASSVARFEAAAHEMDAFVAASEGDNERLRRVLAGPLVRGFMEVTFVFAGPADEEGPEIFVFAPAEPTPSDIERGVLLEGRRADPSKPNELVLFESTAARLGVSAGEMLDLATASPAQAKEVLAGGPFDEPPGGPTIAMHVVGIARNAKDLSATPGDSNFTFLSPAFLERYGGEVGVGTGNFVVDLVDGPDAVPALSAEIEKAFAGSVVPGIEAGAQTQPLDDSIAVITRALLIFALVVALAGFAWIATVLAREQRRAAEDVAAMRALGLRNRDARLLLAGAFAPALVSGVLLAFALAVLLSPLFPVGLARRVDPDPGLHLDTGALLLGAVALAVLLAGISWISATRAVATSGRSPRGRASSLRLDRVVSRLAPAPGAGVRFAFSAPRDGSGRGRPALVGAVLAVVGLVAVGVVASSIDRLLTTPERWGVNWDATAPVEAVDREKVLKNPDVGAAAIGLFDDRVEVADHGALAMVLDPIKGSVGPTLIAGREARAADEVAIGPDTKNSAAVGIGDVVDVRSATERAKFRVVGIAVFPAVGQGLPLADGAQFSPQGAARLKLGDPARNDAGARFVLIRWKGGADQRAALARLGGDEIGAATPSAPVEVARLDEVSGFPAAIAATLVALGAIAVSYTLGTTVTRRRRELGILSVLGFRHAQRRVVIATQATSLAVAALVIGIPLGLIVGRLVWSSISGSIGVATDAVLPGLRIAVGAVLVVVAFNVMAALPAWAAGRLRVVESIRAE